MLQFVSKLRFFIRSGNGNFNYRYLLVFSAGGPWIQRHLCFETSVLWMVTYQKLLPKNKIGPFSTNK